MYMYFIMESDFLVCRQICLSVRLSVTVWGGLGLGTSYWWQLARVELVGLFASPL